MAAAINEVIDPWINARQPKKDIEKQIYWKSGGDTRAAKRARMLVDDSEEDSWSLRSKQAFGNSMPKSRSNWPEDCKKVWWIANRCKKKTLGGVLRSKVDAKEWIAVLNNGIWNFQNDNILPALRLKGFLDQSQDGKTMEEVVDECFTKLLYKSLIQQLHDDSRGQTFVMHDLVNDLAPAAVCFKTGLAQLELNHLSDALSFFDESFLALAKE
ncbi:hypothetical protein KIW84_021991 [Lathyrus oleraceus]|uniref:Disease resistance protein winged helix domain-containing protein n=1 Tax=Pisum sativum TaxID=3888 RepID=A0A9D4YF46_PEA|nr:hypothetical protein KIW84_021991 [Pisum sativum]